MVFLNTRQQEQLLPLIWVRRSFRCTCKISNWSVEPTMLVWGLSQTSNHQERSSAMGPNAMSRFQTLSLFIITVESLAALATLWSTPWTWKAFISCLQFRRLFDFLKFCTGWCPKGRSCLEMAFFVNRILRIFGHIQHFQDTNGRTIHQTV